ncbi:beta-ketoacyl-[acyl-carrier-protein] synthase family protein [Terasakiella sp. A23]|uniref:beta-ketoacyl-[acyl-carrier-protein] synthase family protein n=1 Tax=Terasakiella sp. FCG-A23 TaxID=3080561 RepID=UPI0029530CEC|nr:beta-ketoacyl-[acyl-carrier-protein] synthase family protein [Terasakiella sp. A23]MDV7341033.1 beta-ketoacyl-[acyl-carrier-protein] synthase family protein [Terasakiella sp. A23]
MTFYLNALGIVNPLGCGKEAVAANLFAGSQAGLKQNDSYIPDQTVYVGEVDGVLPTIPKHLEEHNSRNNQLALAALSEINEDVSALIAKYGADRIAVVVGTSTSGIGDNEAGIAAKVNDGNFPDDYDYQRQTVSDLSKFIQKYLDLSGPAMTVSTACTSGAKAVASAARWIEAGICDAAIVGGVDSLCGLTLNGFNALDSLSKGKCQPFSKNRDGINIGEGAALFILSRDVGPVEFCGYGETSDAYHISAPAPDGDGALKAMVLAKGDAEVAYVNLHGTATQLNDAMEAKTVNTLLGTDVPCSSTKALTGHMLGAAGSNELGFLWLSLQHNKLPPHVWDAVEDEENPRVRFAKQGEEFDPADKVLLSNSFAFGGNNICLALKKGEG